MTEPIWDYGGWYRDSAERLRYEYPLTRDSVVMDVGLYTGIFATEISKRYGCHVHAYEPVKRFFFQANSALAVFPNVRCYNYGLAASTREERISIDGDSSSILLGRGVKAETVQVKSVTTAMDELGVKEVDLLKLNIEGAEFELLDFLIDSGYIDRVKHLQVQFHTFVPDAEARRSRIRERLATTHKCDWEYFFVWESHSRMERSHK
jgi:FkbM family methyltransferase